jgi:hypothetical protein
MAKGKKTGGRDFKKGEGGRKPLPADVKAARSLSYEEMCRTVMDVINMTRKDVKKADNDDLPLGKRAIMNAYAKLDYRAIYDYENRLWGKAKETVDLNPDQDLIGTMIQEFRNIK